MSVLCVNLVNIQYQLAMTFNHRQSKHISFYGVAVYVYGNFCVESTVK